jgi:RNA polymerase sigma-70 factor, ECF subfamily
MKARLITAYLRHRQGLYTVALSITRHPSLAEDAVQEAFARVWASQAVSPRDPAAYLFAAVRNAAIDELRRRKPISIEADALVSIYDGVAADPAQDAANAEERKAVCAIVDSLPDDEREVIVMKAYSELTFAQIGEALGQPTSTVADHYHRALEKIRVRLEHKHG